MRRNFSASGQTNEESNPDSTSVYIFIYYDAKAYNISLVFLAYLEKLYTSGIKLCEYSTIICHRELAR